MASFLKFRLKSFAKDLIKKTDAKRIVISTKTALDITNVSIWLVSVAFKKFIIF